MSFEEIKPHLCFFLKTFSSYSFVQIGCIAENSILSNNTLLSN